MVQAWWILRIVGRKGRGAFAQRPQKNSTEGGTLWTCRTRTSALAGSLEELKAKGRLVVHGAHRPILVVYDRGRVFALDNRCPHMGFPLDRGSVEDGILTCHWHHARFDLESGCTFDLWADDAPTFPVEVRNERGLGQDHLRSCRPRHALAPAA